MVQFASGQLDWKGWKRLKLKSLFPTCCLLSTILESQITAAPELTKAGITGFLCKDNTKLITASFPCKDYTGRLVPIRHILYFTLISLFMFKVIDKKMLELGKADTLVLVCLDFCFVCCWFLSTNIAINNNVLWTCLGETLQSAYLFGGYFERDLTECFNSLS